MPPVMKISVDSESFYKAFGIKNIKKIDVTVGNMNAVLNSELIGKYA